MPDGPKISDFSVLSWVYDHLDAAQVSVASCPGRRAYRLLVMARADRVVRNRVVRGVLDRKEDRVERDQRERVAAAAVVEAEQEAVIDGWREEAESMCRRLESFEAMMRDWDPHGTTLRLLGEIRAAQQED